MSEQPGEDGRSPTYLAEVYTPGVTVDELKDAAERICAAAAAMTNEGKPVQVFRSTIVPTDEALLCVFGAASEKLVREIYDQADVLIERISPVISIEHAAPTHPA